MHYIQYSPVITHQGRRFLKIQPITICPRVVLSEKYPIMITHQIIKDPFCTPDQTQRVADPSLSKSKDFDGIVPSIFGFMNNLYLSSWEHSRHVIANEYI